MEQKPEKYQAWNGAQIDNNGVYMPAHIDLIRDPPEDDLFAVMQQF